MRIGTASISFFVLASSLLFAAPAWATPVEFNIPEQRADRALLAFSKQANVEILFSADALSHVQSHAVVGRYEPQTALDLLLHGTSFKAHRSGESKWIIAPTGPPEGTIKGRILAPDGSPARRVRVTAAPTGATTTTDEDGGFELGALRPGRYAVIVDAPDYRPLQMVDVMVRANDITTLADQTIQHAEDPMRLEPFVVKGRATHVSPLDHSDALLGVRTAGGNLDLARTESDALPYMIFNRTQIARSGVVNLNEFLQRELIDSSVGVLPPEQDGLQPSYQVGSANLNLRGFIDNGETVILVNGRRLPEVLAAGNDNDIRPPDVNFIPLSLVQQVEVLPVSASALYTGNAVGGVINIVLRPDVDANATEVTATYTNAMRPFDAPESSLSILHAQALLGGALRIRLNASFTHTVPATEAELGYRQRRDTVSTDVNQPLYRATPNVRSASDGAPASPPVDAGNTPAAGDGGAPPPLFGPGTPSFTSVAPGSDGSGGMAAFRGREGVRNWEFFDSAGRYSTGLDSLDFPYGRDQLRSTYYGSVVYDVLPWLQLAADATYSRTVVHRGFDVFPQELSLKANSPFNPFHQDVVVDLNEAATALGQNYDEARLEFSSLVLSGLIKLPDEWRIAVDSQYSHNLTKYRGLSAADPNRWQQLVDQGVYNPLRDTQVFGPPTAFYDRVLVYQGSRGRFATLGDYDTLDLAVRTMNEALHLPTGNGIVDVGADYRRNHLAKFTDERRYSDGTPAQDPIYWDARSLVRYSVFGELQAPLLPKPRLPHWVKELNADLALRYVAANSSRESNFAPTYGGKLKLAGGITLRGSITTSTRFPTPHMSRLIITPGSGGDGADHEFIYDPVRNQRYSVLVTEVIDPNLEPESVVTQTGGIVFEHGQTHRFRAAIDFVDTHKVNELTFLDQQTVVSKEALWPERVIRAPGGPGDPAGGGIIQQVVTSRANLAARHSQDWTASLDYRWTGWMGGTLEAYARGLYFQTYRLRTQPHSPAVDEINNPDGIIPLLKYRANFGASWSNNSYGFGADGHYFHSRLLPVKEWQLQGHDRIRPFWQFDVFVQTDLTRWLPWNSARYGLRLQARINNVLNAPFPKYVNDAYGTGVQPYGDWRGRVYSLSLTATF